MLKYFCKFWLKLLGYAQRLCSLSLGKTVLVGLSGLMDHTKVIHELLCHPDIDILARDREGRTAGDVNIDYHDVTSYIVDITVLRLAFYMGYG